MRVAPIVGGALGLISFTLFGHDLQILGLIAVIVATVTTVLAAKYDKRQRTTYLHYDTKHPFAVCRETRHLSGFAAFCKSVASSSQHSTGANSLWGRKEAVIGTRRAPCIQTNIEVWGIDAGSTKLYFCPDYLLVLQNGTYAAIAYESLTAHVSVGPFIEHSSLPKDAHIAGYTWQHVRADGRPVRWFNRRLPITMYGHLVLISPDGLNICLQCSNQDVAQQAAEQIRQPAPKRPAQPKSQRPEAERNWEPPSSTTIALKPTMRSFKCRGTPATRRLLRRIFV